MDSRQHSTLEEMPKGATASVAASMCVLASTLGQGVEALSLVAVRREYSSSRSSNFLNNDREPIGSTWSPVRAGVPVLAALVGTGFLVSNFGFGGLAWGCAAIMLVVTLTLFTASRVRVYYDGLDLSLGPFGIIKRYVPRDTIELRSQHNLLYQVLTITRVDGRILGPFSRVKMWDAWPEQALREAGYQFIE